MRAQKHLEICKENAEGGHGNGVGAIFLVLLCTTAAESRRKKKKDMHMGEAKKKATTSGEKRAAWAGNGSWGHSQACGQLSAASPRSWRALPAGCTREGYASKKNEDVCFKAGFFRGHEEEQHRQCTRGARPRPWRRDHEGGWMPGQPVGVDCGRKMNWREISMEAKPLQQWPVWWAGCVCVWVRMVGLCLW